MTLFNYKSNGNRIKLKESLLVGETPKYKIEGDGVDIQVNPWPSDHRAVLSIFEVQ
ncbi:hypothetical protein [Saccharicrinis carchari]|uniref:hypothetical protein n=1 Tax=Saccharicrinis carchari TaxID=1168039 RepID=UPI00163DBB0B|nr:hypothetical protein [Saccharicrinis carchari]